MEELVTAKFDGSAIYSVPTKLYLMLDGMDSTEKRLRGFTGVVLRLGEEEHEFTPDEVVGALYRERERMHEADAVRA